MRDFSFSGYGFLPFGKRNKDERELSLKEQQASLRFITVGSLAMALSTSGINELLLSQGATTLQFRDLSSRSI